MLHMMGRTGMETSNGIWKGSGEKEERTKTGGDKKKKEAESTGRVDISEQVETSGGGSRVKKDRADRMEKAKTRSWSDVVKALKMEDELETTNLDKI